MFKKWAVIQIGLVLIFMLDNGIIKRAYAIEKNKTTLTTGTADNSNRLLEQIARLNVVTDAIQANFDQSKNIQGFRLPVKSSGEITIVRKKGVRWTTQRPYPSVLIINAKGISEIHGTQSQQLTNIQGAAAMTDVMTQILSGDFISLQKSFQILGSVSNQNWRLNLAPIDPQIKQAIVRIDLQGDQYIQQIIIHESSGDKTTIGFSNQHKIDINTIDF